MFDKSDYFICKLGRHIWPVPAKQRYAYFTPGDIVRKWDCAECQKRRWVLAGLPARYFRLRSLGESIFDPDWEANREACREEWEAEEAAQGC